MDYQNQFIQFVRGEMNNQRLPNDAVWMIGWGLYSEIIEPVMTKMRNILLDLEDQVKSPEKFDHDIAAVMVMQILKGSVNPVFFNRIWYDEMISEDPCTDETGVVILTPQPKIPGLSYELQRVFGHIPIHFAGLNESYLLDDIMNAFFVSVVHQTYTRR